MNQFIYTKNNFSIYGSKSVMSGFAYLKSCRVD